MNWTFFAMCPLSLLSIIGVAALVVVVIYWHLSRGANLAAGDFAGFYKLAWPERLTWLFPVVPIAALVWAFFGIEDFQRQMETLSLAYTGSTEILPGVLVVGLIIIYSVVSSFQTKQQIRRWLAQNGCELLRYKWRWSKDDPWAARVRFPLRGSGDSQLSYKLELRDPGGKVRHAHLLWGDYFGLSWLTGMVPVRLIWDEPAENPNPRIRGARPAETAAKNPADLLKPRW